MIILLPIALKFGIKGIFNGCETTAWLDSHKIGSGQTLSLERQVKKGASECYSFFVERTQFLSISANFPTHLITPKGSLRTLQESEEIQLFETGNYVIRFDAGETDRLYSLKFSLNNRSSSRILQSSPSNNSSPISESRTYYNVQTLPSFRDSLVLQSILTEAVDLIQQEGFSTDSLSISLVDLNSSPCCAYAQYSDKQPRFPASVAKLFWIVALYGRYQSGSLSHRDVSTNDEYEMIHNSDNEAASRILDQITGTTSGNILSPEKYIQWFEKRQWLNRFFESSGYRNINITQKNFPIPYLALEEPEGRDLQIRGDDLTNPVRNHLTTFDTARLLYEIETGQAISSANSQRIKSYLRQDLNPSIWQQKEFNAIEGFLGESLPVESQFYTKVGWTSFSRQEAAMVITPDGNTKYILVIFADDSAYAKDWKIFPRVSRLIYNRMISE